MAFFFLHLGQTESLELSFSKHTEQKKWRLKGALKFLKNCLNLYNVLQQMFGFMQCISNISKKAANNVPGTSNDVINVSIDIMLCVRVMRAPSYIGLSVSSGNSKFK